MKVLMAFVLSVGAASLALAQVKIWTTSADFNTGVHLNTSAAVVPGELRMSPQGSAPTPYLSIPIGGLRLSETEGYANTPGRLARLDTRTGIVLGEYRATPSAHASSPSRAVVDSQGNTWVTNSYAGATIAITKIGILVGGSRYYKVDEGVYLPDPLGEYVLDPTYTTGIDRDGDGYIRTSRGLGHALNWVGTAAGDLDSSLPPGASGLVSEAQDELILVYKRFSGNPGDVDGNYNRAIAIDPDDNVWFGYHDNSNVPRLVKVDGQDGHDIVTYSYPTMGGGYTGLWINNKVVNSGIYQLRIADATTGTAIMTSLSPDGCSGIAPLGASTIAVAGQWTNGPIRIVDVNTGSLVSSIPTTSGDSKGITVGTDGDIWLASRTRWYGGDVGVFRYRQNGTLVKRFETGQYPSGVGVDADGNIWVTHLRDNYAVKIDPTLDGGQGRIVATVFLGIGSYNYSDGTGASTVATGRDGEWRGIYDSFRPNLKWGTVNFNTTIPAGTHLEVYARAANRLLLLNGQPWTQVVGSGFSLYHLVEGRYIEMRVRFSRDEGVTTSAALKDLTVRFAPGTISGTIALDSWVREDLPNAKIELIPTGAGAPIVFNDVQLGPLGAFAVTTDSRAEYEMFVTDWHWLRQRLPVPIEVINAGVHGLGFFLINGDIDEDNEVGPSDVVALSLAFGSFDGEPNWNPAADLDGDGEVGPGDFGIISGNFGFAGD